MRRTLAGITAGIVGVAAGWAIAQESPDTTRADEGLEAQLDALLSEIERPEPVDPFADGTRLPDLIIVSTQSVQGEIAPCG